MSLVVGTIVWVSIVTVLVAIAGYVLDRRTARQENVRNNDR
jgi:hypothetical protein